MKEQTPAGLEPEDGLGAGKVVSIDQWEYMTQRPRWRMLREGKGVQQCWEAQWQEFLKTMQSPHLAWENPRLSQTAPWDDAKAFLASFEQVAAACRWPKGEWVARLLPALSGQAEQAFSLLETREKEDYEKLKAAILQGDAIRMEMQRQHFRQFRYQEVEDPQRIYRKLQELCCKWLKPEKHTKEQILELLILEQFLASLPPDLQSWIGAGIPDSCSQAVALVEDFLMSQRETETRKWQEDCMDAKEELSDAALGQIYKEAKQNGSGEVNLLGSGIKCPSHSSLLIPPEEQDVAEAGVTEGLANFKETDVSLHVVERTRKQPSQQTMFWQVLREDHGNVDSLEGLLVPKPDLTANLEKDKEIFYQLPVECERLPGRNPGDEKRNWIKVENSLHGENESEATLRTFSEITERSVAVTAGMPTERCDEKRHPIKTEKFQQGEAGPEKAHRTLAEISRWNLPGTSHIYKQRCESRGQPEEKPLGRENGTRVATEGPPAAVSKTFVVHAEGSKPLFSRYGRKYCYKSGLIVDAGESLSECSMLEEDIRQKRCLDKNQRICISEKQGGLYECGTRFHQRGDFLIGHQNNYAEEKLYEWPNRRDILMQHQGMGVEERLYECAQCGKCFRERGSLKKHQMIHTGKKAHQCSACGKSFIRKGELTRHQRIHTGEKPYRCSQCGKCFSQSGTLTIHRRIHTGEKPFRCPDCGKNFSRKNRLIKHQATHQGQDSYEFPDCEKVLIGKLHCEEKRSLVKRESSQQGELKETHKTSAEISWRYNPVAAEIHGQRCTARGEPAKGENDCSEVTEGLSAALSEASAQEEVPWCSKYGQRYRYKSELLTMQIREGGTECPILKETFQKNAYLDKCQSTEMGEQPCDLSRYKNGGGLTEPHKYEPYDAPEGQSFGCNEPSKEQGKIHSERRPYECPQCGKRFSQREYLMNHQKIHSGEKLHECPECGKIFTSKGGLMIHQRTHTGEKPYNCSQCGKCFRRREHLKKHQRIHTGERLHRCPQCGKSFSQREHLKKHESIHTGEKPYGCPHCGKHFRNKDHLISHQRIHTGEKPFKCPECGRDFSRKDKLSEHQRSHREQRPYQCSECRKSFSLRNTLIRHQRIHERH